MRKKLSILLVISLLLTLGVGTVFGEEKTVVNFWHSMGGSNGELIDQLVAAYNGSQNQVEVIATFQGNYAEAAAKAEAAIFNNNAPDILQLAQDNVGRLAYNGIFANLLPYMEQDQIDPKDFVEAFVADAYYDDELIAIPFGRSAQIVYINEKIMEELNLQVPTTWEEMKAFCEAAVIKDESGNVERYGIAIPFDQWNIFAFIQQAGSTFINEEGTSLGCYEDGTLVSIFEGLREMQQSGALYYCDPTNNIAGSLFAEEKVIMKIESSGGIRSTYNTLEDKFPFIVAPMPAGKIASMPTGGNGIGILAASKNVDAAWDFVKWFITNDEGGLFFVQGSGYLPFTQTMAQSQTIQEMWKEYPNFKIAFEALENGDDSYRVVNLTPLIAELNTCMSACLIDEADIQKSVDNLKDAVEIILAEGI